MTILKAKIKINSIHYNKGLNQKGKAVWLRITGFRPNGLENYKIETIKEFNAGFPVFQNTWIRRDEIVFKRFEDGQLTIF